MTWVKICGLTIPEDVQCVAEAGADAIGLNFAASPRRVSPETARALLGACPPALAGVGVFVDAPAAEVRATLEATGCRLAQLHGAEEGHYLDWLRPYRAIKVIRVGSGISARWLEPYREAEAILLDTYVPGQAGGTGQRFDHRLAAELAAQGWRLIVAGGLTPDNVGEVVRSVRPYGVDVSSGVEAAPGRKDHAKVRDFIAAVRAADTELR